MISDKQKEILQFIQDSEDKQITKKQAVKLIGNCYYANKSKHTGDVLSRMVKRGLLKRIKPGLFEVGHGIKYEKETIENPNQTELF